MCGPIMGMDKKEISKILSGPCPSVWNHYNPNMTYEEGIEYLLDYARKQIAAWNKVINYWSKSHH
jgi:hypothetical protein